LATGYHKLLFPHIHRIEDVADEDKANFKALYAHYCLEPAVSRRQIIRQQCHLIDKEFKADMAKFDIKQ
jgi:ATP-dependent Lon protease